MKTLIQLSLAALLAVVAGGATAAGKGVGVWDLGKDGDVRYYQIQCGDGRTVVLESNFETQESCFPASKGEPNCLKTLDVRKAGEQACAATAK
jgi:hypothetical protein